MPSQTRPANPLSRYLAATLRIEAPSVAGALAVFPVFGPEPQLTYLAFSQALPRGLVIKELDQGASVNDLLVHNPTGEAVLLYEGEEVLGAQQNRTFDVSILIAPATRLTVPVSCVEAGRWDGARHDEAFSPAPQAAYPELRRAKARAVRERLAGGRDARAQQSEVWQAVAAKSAGSAPTPPPVRCTMSTSSAATSSTRSRRTCRCGRFSSCSSLGALRLRPCCGRPSAGASRTVACAMRVPLRASVG